MGLGEMFADRGRTHDEQRRRVYNAESMFSGWTAVLRGFDKLFPDIQSVQAWVDDLVKKPGFRARWRTNSIPVGDGRRRRRACGGPEGIKLPRWSRCIRVILHEVAHHLTYTPTEWHGPDFCRTFVTLVEIVYGRHVAMLFEGYLRGRDCKVAPEKPVKALVAACERVKPLVLKGLPGTGTQVFHTHPDRLDGGFPRWQIVHQRTGICRDC